MVAAAGAPHGPRAQLYLSFPREFVETKQRGVNTINISPLAYSAAEGLEKLQTECRESTNCTQGLPGLKYLHGIALNSSATAGGGVEGAGVLYWGRRAVGAREQFFLRKAPEESQVSRCELDIDWSITLVLLRGWENNFLRFAILKCLAW